MPKLIDYPRTSYAGAWEVADVVDDTGGKCALDTCARKLNRKVSGSFKAIVGSAVKFGLLTSKRELLTTTTLFRRIKHAYDKQEELLFHREAFLTPPLFTQLCRKFRSRELPVQMLDIMLIREFDVEEINAQSVAKAFIDGARMVGVLDERNMIADIDQLAAQQPPRRELASPELGANSFRAELARTNSTSTNTNSSAGSDGAPKPTPVAVAEPLFSPSSASPAPVADKSSSPLPFAEDNPEPVSAIQPGPLRGADAVSSLFGLTGATPATAAVPPADATRTPGAQRPGLLHAAAQRTFESSPTPTTRTRTSQQEAAAPPPPTTPRTVAISETNRNKPEDSPASSPAPTVAKTATTTGFRIELSGPGLNTVLDVQDEDDLALARVLLEKIGRQLRKTDS
ncbi:hypothetical protein [uncultured Hymenobacter sp.]|uniref:hypothetical protein n=1 Tax=uncultured Hymenobacter sp. TaxID=170016 RepID=UPI0035CA48BA